MAEVKAGPTVGERV